MRLSDRLPRCGILAALVFAASGSPALAAFLPLGDAANYSVLYTGNGGHNLQITNVTIGGNVGVAGTGHVNFSGPGTISGELDFAAANTGQFSNSNGSNVGPTSVQYSKSNVQTDISTTLANLSSSLAGLGNSIALSGTQTVNESAGLLDTINGTTYRIFNVSGYSSGDGKVLTINGDGSGDPVIFNFASALGNVNLGGDVTLNGLTSDQVLYNFIGSGNNIDLNNNASSFPNASFQGVILGLNDTMSMVNANLTGRFFGGDSSDMQIVSGDHITTPTLPIKVPEVPSFLLFAAGLIGLAAAARTARPASATSCQYSS